VRHVLSKDENDPLYCAIKKENIKTTILATPLSVASTTLLAKQSTPVKCFFSTDKVFVVKDDTPLRDVRERFLMHKKVYALAVVDSHGIYKNLLKRYDIESLNLIDLVLVDHNELNQ